MATMSQSSIVAAAGNIARYVQGFEPQPHVLHILYQFPRLDFCSISLNPSFLCRTVDRSVFKPIVQISVIDRSESSDCHLLAVSHAGKDYRAELKMMDISRTPSG